MQATLDIIVASYRSREFVRNCLFSLRRSATVFHVKAGASGRDRRARPNWALHYGMCRLYRQHYADQRNPLLSGVVYVGTGVELALSMARSGYRRRVAPKLTPSGRALREGHR